MNIKRIDLESFIHRSSRMVRLLECTRLRAMLTALVLVLVVTNGQTQSAQTEAAQEEVMTTINLQIGSKTFTAKVFNNASSQALLAMLPMTITMIELNENEKYYTMPKELPTNPQQVLTINIGDLMLYGSDCLVLFYKSFTTSYGYTRLGYIEDVSGLADALGSGSVQATFRLAM